MRTLPLRTTTLSLIVVCACALVARADEKQVTDDEIKSTVNGHMDDLKACMGKHGSATGTLKVEFAIEGDGKVSMSKVGAASSNHSLDACIAGHFKEWTFPKPRNKKQWLSMYPIIFSAPKPPPKGTLSENDIVTTITAKLPEVRACLEEARKESKDKKDKKDVSGIVELGVVVSPAGAVVEVNTLSTTTGVPTLDACIIARVKTWAFPKPQGGGEAAFKYPFKLNVK